MIQAEEHPGKQDAPHGSRRPLKLTLSVPPKQKFFTNAGDERKHNQIKRHSKPSLQHRSNEFELRLLEGAYYFRKRQLLIDLRQPLHHRLQSQHARRREHEKAAVYASNAEITHDPRRVETRHHEGRDR